MLSQMVFIHITLLLLDPQDIHLEGKNIFFSIQTFLGIDTYIYTYSIHTIQSILSIVFAPLVVYPF